MKRPADIEKSRKEYLALPNIKWKKDYFDETTGGFVATHILKEKDNLHRTGIVAEVNACFELAKTGKHVLRLPENVPALINTISIDGRSYCELLKYKLGNNNPRGYPDAYFDAQTWDFKTSTYNNVETIRQLIKDGRKANNVIFIMTDIQQINKIQNAIDREVGNRLRDNSWILLPDVFYLIDGKLSALWKKKKGR